MDESQAHSTTQSFDFFQGSHPLHRSKRGPVLRTKCLPRFGLDRPVPKIYTEPSLDAVIVVAIVEDARVVCR